jgi:O-antigen/teichoic acid export membrane protein
LLRENWTLISNASSLVGTFGVTSGLGFFYWLLAAYFFPPSDVGAAAAAVAAMTLLGSFSVLGFGTLLMGELVRQPGQALSLLTAALLSVGVLGALTGALFAFLARWLSPELGAFFGNAGGSALFSLGVSLTAILLVLDDALVGLLCSALQFGRNLLFSFLKLGLLLLAGSILIHGSGLLLYGTWVLGALLSLVILVKLPLLKHRQKMVWQLDWQTWRNLQRVSLVHHLFNMALQAPELALPLVVTTLLSATLNAGFYIAMMIVGFLLAIPFSLTTVLYAVSAGQPATLGERMRLTVRASLIVGVLVNVALFVGAEWLLGWFGDSYAAQAGWCLRILALGAFPAVVKYHYVAVCRIHNQIIQALWLVIGGALLEILLAGIGASASGLAGLSVGWVVALCFEAAAMTGSVYRTIRPVHTT